MPIDPETLENAREAHRSAFSKISQVQGKTGNSEVDFYMGLEKEDFDALIAEVGAGKTFKYVEIMEEFLNKEE